jgi:hypothetical protein
VEVSCRMAHRGCYAATPAISRGMDSHPRCPHGIPPTLTLAAQRTAASRCLSERETEASTSESVKESASEDLAVVGQDLLGAAIAGQRGPQPVADRTVRSRAINFAGTHNREWPSIPVNALAQLPSASGKPPTMSICHNSIGAPRSQRFHLRAPQLRQHRLHLGDHLIRTRPRPMRPILPRPSRQPAQSTGHHSLIPLLSRAQLTHLGSVKDQPKPL